jgi:hypothetical protein
MIDGSVARLASTNKKGRGKVTQISSPKNAQAAKLF